MKRFSPRRFSLALPLALLFAAACDAGKAPTAPSAATRPGAAVAQASGPPTYVTVHGQYANFAGVPVTLVYDVPNPDGHDLVCTIRNLSGTGSPINITLPSCTGTYDLLTPVASDYSQQGGCGEPGVCSYLFSAVDRTLSRVVGEQLLFQGFGRPYALADVRALTKPAGGPVPAAFRDHCGGGHRDACVQFTVFAPGQIGPIGRIERSSFEPFVQVTWGDGTPSEVMSQTQFNSAVTVRHTYAAAGTYTVRVVAVTAPFDRAPDFVSLRSFNRAADAATVTVRVD